MTRLATIGLTSEQAEAVADMLSEVETATWAHVLAHLETRKEGDRLRVRRYHERLGLSSREWRELRYAVINRDGPVCVYCGATDHLHVDHIIPLIQGGTNDLSNLAVACRECNCGKSGRTPEQWRASQ